MRRSPRRASPPHRTVRLPLCDTTLNLALHNINLLTTVTLLLLNVFHTNSAQMTVKEQEIHNSTDELQPEKGPLKNMIFLKKYSQNFQEYQIEPKKDNYENRTDESIAIAFSDEIDSMSLSDNVTVDKPDLDIRENKDNDTEQYVNTYLELEPNTTSYVSSVPGDLLTSTFERTVAKAFDTGNDTAERSEVDGSVNDEILNVNHFYNDRLLGNKDVIQNNISISDTTSKPTLTTTTTTKSLKSLQLAAAAARRSPKANFVEVAESAAHAQTVSILGLFELSVGAAPRPEGASELAAARLAVRHVNDRRLLPGYSLHLLTNDTKCDPGVGVDRFFHALYSGLGARVLMLLGSACSEVTETIAKIVPYWNIVQNMVVTSFNFSSDFQFCQLVSNMMKSGNQDKKLRIN